MFCAPFHSDYQGTNFHTVLRRRTAEGTRSEETIIRCLSHAILGEEAYLILSMSLSNRQLERFS
jgi:hypothetical protein